MSSYRRAVGSIRAVRTTLPQVVLTYDDGPEPVGTERVLSALADQRATATFFVLLTRARRDPQLVRDVVAAGHEVGLHGPDHRRLTDFTPREIRRRTRDAKWELEDILGRRVRWFRPPYGKQRFLGWAAATSCGLGAVSWGADMLDWLDVAHERRVASAVEGVRPGTIVLAHDGYAGAQDGVDDGPAPAFDRGALARSVLAAYRERGWQARSLEDALVHGSAVREPWFVAR